MLHETRILDRANPVPDPLRPDAQRIPHAFRPRRLPRMAREAQSPVASLRVQIAEPVRRTVGLKPSQADRHHSFINMLRREIEYRPGCLSAPLAGGVEN